MLVQGAAGCSDVQEMASGTASMLLLAESDGLATQTGTPNLYLITF